MLEPLRELDEVAYLRFASVYQAFDTLEDFEAAIALLRAERDATGGDRSRSRPPGGDAQRPRTTGTPAPPAAPNPAQVRSVSPQRDTSTTSRRHGQGGQQ